MELDYLLFLQLAASYEADLYLDYEKILLILV